MTPEKGLSIPKYGKRKAYRARKNINRASMKKRRVYDQVFRKAGNESRLKRFNNDYEDSDFREKHNEISYQTLQRVWKILITVMNRMYVT